MRVIILAAGQAVQLDGYNKLLIKDPANNEIGKIIIKNTLNFVIFINLDISVIS